MRQRPEESGRPTTGGEPSRCRALLRGSDLFLVKNVLRPKGKKHINWQNAGLSQSWGMTAVRAGSEEAAVDTGHSPGDPYIMCHSASTLAQAWWALPVLPVEDPDGAVPSWLLCTSEQGASSWTVLRGSVG